MDEATIKAWHDWQQQLTLQWNLMDSPVILRQLGVLGAVVVVALLINLLLDRREERVLGGSEEKSRLRTTLRAAKLPVLILLLGHLALALYKTTGRPTFTLNRLVNAFWFIAGFALVSKAAVVLFSVTEARRFVRRLLLPLAALLVILHMIGLLPVVWALAHQPLVTLNSGQISWGSFIVALLLVLVVWYGARAGKALFLRAVLPRTETDLDLARSVATFVQVTIVFVGFWAALVIVGVEFSSLTLFISALTVGIGFGLQDLIKNIMGGIILLGEGHVRPKEVFEIGGETGVVERIGLRSTTVRNWDGAQVIVPNSFLITEKIKDLTELRRIDITVGIAADADPSLAKQLLLEIASDHPDIVDDPPPSVYFLNFGSSSLDLTLYCHVPSRSVLFATKSDLHFAILSTMRAHHIEIPNPQYDIHLWPKSEIQSPSQSGSIGTEDR